LNTEVLETESNEIIHGERTLSHSECVAVFYTVI